ncbi:MAG: 4Fe-4S binding protein [Eggerthellaceae bacterium]|nr:4Fe-4S binding protein [Eggerthellaceae bacterium]
MALTAQFKRHLVQLLAALLYNLNLTGFTTGTIYQGSLKGVCVPGLNCYSCPGAVGACPLGALQAALVGSGQRLPFYIVGTILAFGALFGRTVCGWLCPFGLIQDALDKAPLPKIGKGAWSRAFSWGKYLVLAGLVVVAPVALLFATGVGTPAFCAWLCPAGTLEAGIPLLAANSNLRIMLGALFNWKVALLAALGVAALFVYRPFCRFLCPLGALYSFFNRFALVRWRVDEGKCSGCGTCLTACKADVRQVSDRECIQCGNCAPGCETRAIRFTLHDMLQSKGRLAPGEEGAARRAAEKDDGRRKARP